MTKMESTPRYIKGNLYQLNPNELQPDPNQPRKYFDPTALQDLVESIKDKGILQPILFRMSDEGNLFVVAGERRFQAAKEAELETIPAIFVEGNYDEIALVENILREDLTAVEFAEAAKRIMDEHSYTQDQLTTIIGKAKSTVSEILSLNKLPEEIRDECRNNPSIPRKALIQFAKKNTSRGMMSAYNKYKEKVATPPKPKGPRGKRKSWQEKFSSKSDELMNFVTDMDLGTMDAAARNDLVSLIEELKRNADNLIEQIQLASTTEPTSE